MTPIERLADALVEGGVRIGFGITGSGPSYQFIRALIQHPGFRYVPVSNESSAVVAAATYQRQTGHGAVAVAIKGPGFANLLAGLAACHLERWDVLAIAEDHDDAAPREREHKRLDQWAMVAPVAHALGSLGDPSTWPIVLRDNRYAPGPRYLALADAAVPAAEREDATVAVLPFEEAVLHRVRAAERPVLIVGQVAQRLGLSEELLSLNTPVFTTVAAKGSVDERHPNAYGVYTGVGLSLVSEGEVLAAADCVVAVGVRNAELLGVAGKSSWVNLDVARDGTDPSVRLVSEADLRQVLTALRRSGDWAASIRTDVDGRFEAWRRDQGWSPAGAFSVIDEGADPLTMVLDTGFFCTVGEHVYRAGPVKRFVGSSAGRNMGLSMPMALGAAMAGDPVCCVVGDGGIRYHLGDLRTVAELGLPVCVVLMSDGQYGSVEAYVGEGQRAPGIARPLGTGWCAAVSGMGMAVTRVYSREHFSRVWTAWDRRSPMFLELPFDPVIYGRMTTEIRR